MKKFKSWLTEAISSSSSDSVNNIIKKYLQKKLGGKVYKMPGVEEYTNSKGHGFGIRYFYDSNKSVRFNWKTSSISAIALNSIDVWDGTKKDPSWHMEFDTTVSLVTTLPTIVDFLKSPFGQGTFYAIPADNLNEIAMHEGLLIEAVSVNEIDGFNIFLNELTPGGEIKISALSSKYGWRIGKISDFLRITHPYSALFVKDGRAIKFAGTQADIKNLQSKKDEILHAMGGTKVTVSTGGTKETYQPMSDQENDIETKTIEKVAYEEQLKHLVALMRLVIKGASNALFVAGRGGTGKTQTVETELAKAGLQDGDGYYKNTGSASPIGIYTSLYDNRTDIVLFDDCDSALNDQEGRNLIKAATDTKKIRKIAWNKKSSMIVPLDQYENATGEDGERPTNNQGNYLYPNNFEFTGKVIFISNLTLNKLDPDGALRTRGFIIDIDPTDAELIDYMAKIAHLITPSSGKKMNESDLNDIIDEIRKSPKKSDISLRKLVRGINIKDEMGDDPMWKTILHLYA